MRAQCAGKEAVQRSVRDECAVSVQRSAAISVHFFHARH